MIPGGRLVLQHGRRSVHPEGTECRPHHFPPSKRSPVSRTIRLRSRPCLRRRELSHLVEQPHTSNGSASAPLDILPPTGTARRRRNSTSRLWLPPAHIPFSYGLLLRDTGNDGGVFDLSSHHGSHLTQPLLLRVCLPTLRHLRKGCVGRWRRPCLRSAGGATPVVRVGRTGGFWKVSDNRRENWTYD